jgi:hypothetical protein
MTNPIISWFIKEQDSYVQEDEYYLGSFNKDSEINVFVQVWNNRYGSKDVDSIDDARLAIYFDTLEDSSLLQYCTISVNDTYYSAPEIELQRAIFSIGKLSGNYNDGTDQVINQDNFKNIKLKFSNFPGNLKNGLKNMYLDIEFD